MLTGTVELGHTDTDHTTCLHVPSIGIVVAGDAAYNDVHTSTSQNQMLKHAVSGLLRLTRSSHSIHVQLSPHISDLVTKTIYLRIIIEETRQYICDFDQLAQTTMTTTTAQGLYEKMLELYPNWVNPGWALWSSAGAVKP